MSSQPHFCVQATVRFWICRSKTIEFCPLSTKPSRGHTHENHGRTANGTYNLNFCVSVPNIFLFFSLSLSHLFRVWIYFLSEQILRLIGLTPAVSTTFCCKVQLKSKTKKLNVISENSKTLNLTIGSGSRRRVAVRIQVAGLRSRIQGSEFCGEVGYRAGSDRSALTSDLRRKSDSAALVYSSRLRGVCTFLSS